MSNLKLIECPLSSTVRLTSLALFLCILGGCKPPVVDLTSEIVAAQVAVNEQRCAVDESLLMSCTYKSWGTNKLVLRVEEQLVTYNDISIKVLDRQLKLDPKFPSLDYSILNRRKDPLYQQLEKSGYCAYIEVETADVTPRQLKKTKSKSKRRKSTSQFITFIPASILSGLMEEGTVFIRTIQKKKKHSKKISDEIENPKKRQLMANEVDYSDLPAECVVELRGKDDIEPSQEESDEQESEKKQSDNLESEGDSQELTPEY